MDKQTLLDQVEKNVINCKKCKLCETAKNAVPGEGDINSPLCFIGEAPGRFEDESGRPFVGRAGKLLEYLLGEIGYTREKVWIGNIIKHRPPKNRDPLPVEIAACQPYLTMQLKALDPKLIVTLGRFAMNYFYKEGKITRDHGTLKKIGDMYIYPVYHPAAGLRNPNFKKTLLEDFLKIPRVLEYIEKESNGQNTVRDEDFVDKASDPQLEMFS